MTSSGWNPDRPHRSPSRATLPIAAAALALAASCVETPDSDALFGDDDSGDNAGEGADDRRESGGQFLIPDDTEGSGGTGNVITTGEGTPPVSTGGVNGTGGSGDLFGGTASAGGRTGTGGTGSTDCSSRYTYAVRFSGNGHCYAFFSSGLDFDAAQEDCETRGAHLATVTSEAENSFVWGLANVEQWIGASDGEEETSPESGTMAWVTGEAWGWDNFASDQPNTDREDCESGYGTCYQHCVRQGSQESAGDWNDQPCWNELGYSCEWDG